MFSSSFSKRCALICALSLGCHVPLSAGINSFLCRFNPWAPLHRTETGEKASLLKNVGDESEISLEAVESLIEKGIIVDPTLLSQSLEREGTPFNITYKEGAFNKAVNKDDELPNSVKSRLDTLSQKNDLAIAAAAQPVKIVLAILGISTIATIVALTVKPKPAPQTPAQPTA